MVLGNVSQLGDRRLDMIECVVGALVFEALPQTSPKRRIAHVVEQGLVERIAENVAEKLVHGHATLSVVAMIVIVHAISFQMRQNRRGSFVWFRRSKCLPRV